MASHIYEDGRVEPAWCPFTGAEGKKDFAVFGGESWARCEGVICPKATIQRNVFGNLFLLCGGEWEPDAGLKG